MLPDLEVGDVCDIGALHGPGKGPEVIAVQSARREGFGFLFDLRIEVDVFLQVKVVLAVFPVEGYELSAHGSENLMENGFHGGPEKLGILFRQRQIQAEVVPELFSGYTDGSVDISRSETVNAQGVDDADSHGLVLLLGKGLPDAVFQYLALVNHHADVRIGAERRIVFQALPVGVIGYEPRLCPWGPPCPRAFSWCRLWS
jgi:hypothetical protein